MCVVTDDPGSKPDQKYAWLRNRQNYMGRISKGNLPVQYTGTL